MSIKTKQEIFQVEPEVYETEYNQFNLLPENMFQEKVRWTNKVESVFSLWPTTVRQWEGKPFAFGFIDYKHP